MLETEFYHGGKSPDPVAADPIQHEMSLGSAHKRTIMRQKEQLINLGNLTKLIIIDFEQNCSLSERFT